MANKLSNEELFHFCEQFSIILKSGIPAIEGLRILGDDSVTAQGKALMEQLLGLMDETGNFADTLERSGAFPAPMISYVRLGEQTGCLDEVMEILTHYYEQEIATAAQVRSAITYPLLMLGMMVAVVIILLIKVLPVFSQVFRQMGSEMTGLSGRLLNLGLVMRRNSSVFMVLLAAVIALICFCCFSRKGRGMLIDLVCRVPYFRQIPQSIDYSRITQGISMGLRSGLGPEDSMEMAKDLIRMPEVKQQLTAAADQLREGVPFSKALTGSGLFTGMEARLISIGFQSGSGDDVMQRLAHRYSEDSIARIQQVISILEPTIVIILTLMVGLVLLSVMLPLLGVLSELMS